MALKSETSTLSTGEINRIEETFLGHSEFWWKRCLITLSSVAWGGMLFLCTVENHSRIGRVAFTMAAFVFLLVGVWRRWFPVKHLQPFLLPLAVVYLTSLISCFFSIDPLYSLDTFFKHHFWYGLIFLSVGCWASTPRRQRSLLWGLVGAGIISSLLGIVLFFFAKPLQEIGLISKFSDYVYTIPVPGGGEKYRAQGLMQSVTKSALVYIFVLPAAFILTVHSLRKNRFISLGVCLLCILLGCWYLLLTGARGAWIATGVSLAMTCLVIGLSGRVITVGILLAGTACLAPSSPRERALTFVYDFNSPDVLLSKRVTLWKQGQEPLMKNIWTGVGYGADIFLTDYALDNFPLFSGNRRQPDLHSLYLQTLAEVGLLGCLAYGWLILTLLYYGWTRFFREGSLVMTPGLIYGLPVMISVLLVGVVYYMNEGLIAQMLAACMGLIPACNQQPKDSF